MTEILVVSAHAADFCTRAGGTLCLSARNGASITVFALTFGERGESAGYWAANAEGTIDECKSVRRREATAAAACLSANSEFFDYDDYPLDMGVERIRDLTKRILQIRPNIILTHWLEDSFNQDHAVTANAVIRAVSSAGMLGALPNTPAHYVPDIFYSRAPCRIRSSTNSGWIPTSTSAMYSSEKWKRSGNLHANRNSSTTTRTSPRTAAFRRASGRGGRSNRPRALSDTLRLSEPVSRFPSGSSCPRY